MSAKKIPVTPIFMDLPTVAQAVALSTATIERLERDYDGWILHAAATPRSIATLAPLVERTGAR